MIEMEDHRVHSNRCFLDGGSQRGLFSRINFSLAISSNNDRGTIDPSRSVSDCRGSVVPSFLILDVRADTDRSRKSFQFIYCFFADSDLLV